MTLKKLQWSVVNFDNLRSVLLKFYSCDNKASFCIPKVTSCTTLIRYVMHFTCKNCVFSRKIWKKQIASPTKFCTFSCPFALLNFYLSFCNLNPEKSSVTSSREKKKVRKKEIGFVSFCLFWGRVWKFLPFYSWQSRRPKSIHLIPAKAISKELEIF